MCLDEGPLTEKAGAGEVCVCVSTPDLLFLSVFLMSAWKRIIPCCHRGVKVPVCELLCACLTKRTLPTSDLFATAAIRWFGLPVTVALCACAEFVITVITCTVSLTAE